MNIKTPEDSRGRSEIVSTERQIHFILCPPVLFANFLQHDESLETTVNATCATLHIMHWLPRFPISCILHGMEWSEWPGPLDKVAHSLNNQG